MNRYVWFLAICSMMVLPAVTHAGESGWYGGLSISNAFENFDDGGLGLDFDDSIVLGAQLGFRFASDEGKAQPAIELKYKLFDEFDISVPGYGTVGDVEA